MKISCGLITIAAGLVVGGCGKNESAPPPPAAAAPAPANSQNGYLGTLVKGQQTAIKTIDVTSLNENVRLFNVQEGRYPVDLKELVTKNYLGALPDPPAGMKLVYDAKEGKVSVAPL